ncbi:MAG: YncE family protein, partial [Candidatus Micrarchaeota archaeon]|nr:YncE family protein [Candidatus Micrarchaeota archaeon]
VAYDSGKGAIYVTNYGASTVSVISDNTNTVTATIPVGTNPYGVAYDSGKGAIYVTNYGASTVSVISDNTNTVTATIPVGAGPIDVAYDSGKGAIYVTNYGASTVSVISDNTNTVTATIPVGAGPYGVAYDSGKGAIYVANYGASTVSVISDNTNTVTATIPVGAGPSDVAYDSGKGAIYVTNYGASTVSVISDKIQPVITNWYHSTGGSTLSQILGNNQATLNLGCTPPLNTLQPQGENILYDCNSGTTSVTSTTESINSYSGTSSSLFSTTCASGYPSYMYALFPTETSVYNFCMGTQTTSYIATTGYMGTPSGSTKLYACDISGVFLSPSVFQSAQKFAITYNGNCPIYLTPLLRFNTNTTNGIDPNIPSFTTDLCDFTSMPGYALRQINNIGCDTSISANQIHYLNGTSLLQVNNYYSNNALSFFSSIQDNQYKSALTLLPNLLGISAPYTDFILYTPSANYMIVLTGTSSSGNIYYVNINTVTSLLAKNYAYQSYLMTTTSTTSTFGLSDMFNGGTVRLYGPSNMNTTLPISGLFTVTSPYQIQAFPSSTSNGQTRIIDPQWTNVPATNYPIIWTATQLLYPIYLTVANAPTDAGLIVTNNNVVINSTQQTWVVLRLDSTH